MSHLLKTQRGTRVGRPIVPSWTHVQRVTTALPATTTDAIFTVSGGRVLVQALIGEVTTVIQTQACNLKVTINPTTGTSGDVAADLNISADEVGALYLVAGDGSALDGGTAGGAFVAAGSSVTPFVVPIGTLDITTSATNTGSIKWDLWYTPLDEAAYVEAA